MKKRIFSFLMALVMVLTILPMPALAADGLCEHHPAHTADCNYAAPVAGQPCSHEGKCSADTCGFVPAQPGVPCGHTHDETCGWSAGKDEVPCDKGCAEVDENGVIIHAEGCAYAPAVSETPCSHQCSLEVCGYVAPVEGVKCGHQHDKTCGYVQAVAGAACGFVCTQCAQQSDPDQGEAVCTCDVKCNEQVNADCPVCSVSTEGCKGKAAEDVPTCNCADKCTEGAVNLDCPLCSAEHADLSGCIGKAAPVCNCADQCTAEKVKADCPVCGAENADLTNCIGTPAPAVTENAKAVQALIDALPTLEEVQAITDEESWYAALAQAQAAYEAWLDLTGEEQATVDASHAEALLTYFRDTTINFLPNENEAQIDETTYPTLKAALEDAQSGDTVTLLKDVTLTADLTIPTGVTLEVPVNLTLTVEDGGKLENNGTTTGDGTITGDGTFTRGANGTYTLKVTKKLPTQADEAMNVVKTPYGVVVQSLLGPDWGRPQYKKGTDGTLQNSPIFPYENGESVDSINYYMQITEDGEIFKVPNASNNNVSNNPSGDGTERYNGTLTPGTTYYFNLSGQGIPGNANSSLPDSTMNWVPFTFVGDVFAYALTSSSSGKTEASELAAAGMGFGSADMRSLFIADYNLTTETWTNLHDNNLIFGKTVNNGGISYTLRAPSAGSKNEGDETSSYVTPRINEWDSIRAKDAGYFKNLYGAVWGQDTSSQNTGVRAKRANNHLWSEAGASNTTTAYRPVLEIQSGTPKVVTVNLNNGKIGNSTVESVNIVMAANSTAYPDGSTLTAPEGKVFDKWQESEDGATITAQWKNDTGPFTVTGGEYGEDYEWNGADGVKKLTILKDTQLTISTPNNNKDNLAQAHISSGSDNAVNLILDGVHITAAGCSGTSGALVAASNLTINLAANSTNTLSGPDSTGTTVAIISMGTLTIEGSGTLNATGGNTSGSYNSYNSYGIMAEGTISIAGGKITATGGSATGDGAPESYGIRAFKTDGSSAQPINITGGEVTATGGSAPASYGISGSTITISGGTGTASADENATTKKAMDVAPQFKAKEGETTVTVGSKNAHTEQTMRWGTLPAITTQPTAQAVTAGKTATFTVAAENGTSYQWQSSSNGTDWTNVSGATNASYTIENATTAMNGTQYRCVVSNEYGSVTSNAVSLTVTTDPTTCGHPNAKDDGNCLTAVTCPDCKATVTEAKESHSYTNNCDPDCNNTGCKYTRDTAHSFGWSVDEKTKNVLTGKCTCGETVTATITAKDAAYDGEEHKTATVAYSKNWKLGELEIQYNPAKPVEVGTVKASISMDTTKTREIVTASTTYKITKPTFTVTFDSNGGSSVDSQTVESGGKVVEPKDPTRSKYTFKGWYTDEKYTKAYDFDTEVSSSFTLYAKWKRTSTAWWDNPKTGDYIMIAVGVLVVSSVALAGLLVYSKKKKK